MCERLLITVREAAERLGLGRSLTYEFIRKGELASIKIGGARRVALVDLDTFVERLRAEASGQGDR